jgi:hypothetical protein
MENMLINHLAVLAAALSDLLVGALWFSPVLFYKPWMKANGFTEEILKKGNPALIFGLTFLFSLIISYNLAFFLGDANTTALWGLMAGVLAGLGWAAMGLGIISLFERRPPSYFFIHAGYLTVAFALKGLIIGVWR